MTDSNHQIFDLPSKISPVSLQDARPSQRGIQAVGGQSTQPSTPRKILRYARQQYTAFHERRAQKRLQLKIAAIKQRHDLIMSYRSVMHPSLIIDLSVFHDSNQSDIDLLAEHYLSTERDGFISALKNLTKHVNDDRDSFSLTYTFDSDIDDFFVALGNEQICQRLRDVAKGYHVRASSNVLLTGVLAAQRRNGMALLAAAEGISNQTKAASQNGEINYVIERYMRDIRVAQSTANLNAAHVHYLRSARRLLAVNDGDQGIVARAYFSLIYNNGDCKVIFPDANASRKQLALHEFKNNFSDYIWSPKEAAAHIDQITSQNARAKEAVGAGQLVDYVKKYYFTKKQTDEIARILNQHDNRGQLRLTG